MIERIIFEHVPEHAAVVVPNEDFDPGLLGPRQHSLHTLVAALHHALAVDIPPAELEQHTWID